MMNFKKLKKELKRLKDKKEFHSTVSLAAAINGRDNIKIDNPMGSLINVGVSIINMRKETILEKEIKKIKKLKKEVYDDPITTLWEEIENIERYRPEAPYNDLSWTIKDVDSRINTIREIENYKIDYRPKKWWLW